MATKASVEELNAVPNFLMFVDNQIYIHGLSLLKLSLYPSEGLAWNKLDACTEPSQIFHLLQETSSKEVALQKFLFALEAIGGTVRGKHCVEEVKKRLNELQYPSPLDFKKQTKKFCFFHSLVKIARKLPDKAGRKMKKHFSNHPVIQSNHRRFDTIPELFIVLYQTKIISEDDSEALQHELKKCKKKYYKEGAEEQTRLNKCLSYLTNFHQHGSPKDPFTTADEKSTASSLESSMTAGSESDGGSVSTGGGRKRRVEKLQRQGQTKDRNSNESDDGSTPPRSLLKSKSKEANLTERDENEPPPLSETPHVKIQQPNKPNQTPSLPTCGEPLIQSHRRGEDGDIPRPCAQPQEGSTPSWTLLGSKSKDRLTEIAVLHEELEEDQERVCDTPLSEPFLDNETPTASLPTVTTREPLIQSSAPEDRDDNENGREGGDVHVSSIHSNQPQPPPENTSQWQLKVLKYGLGILILCAVVSIPAVIPCYFIVWSPLIDLQHPNTTQQLDGSTVILADMNSYFVKNVTVKEIEKEEDVSHQIDLYITQQECKNLPTNTTSNVYNGTKLKNVNSTYMLAGSRVDLHVHASTMYSVSKAIAFYIVATVDSSTFDPHDTTAHRYHINVGTNGNMEPTNVTRKIQSSNYYSLIFVVPHEPVTLFYEMTVEIRSIDLIALNTTAFGSLRRNGDSAHKKLAHWQSHYCLIAFIYRSTIISPYIHTKVIFTPDYVKTLGLTVAPAVVWTISMTGLVIICCYSIYKRRSRHSNYNRL